MSQKADINLGISTIIWRVNVFVLALADFIFYGQKLKYFHIVGLVFITICTILVSIEGIKNDES